MHHFDCEDSLIVILVGRSLCLGPCISLIATHFLSSPPSATTSCEFNPRRSPFWISRSSASSRPQFISLSLAALSALGLLLNRHQRGNFSALTTPLWWPPDLAMWMLEKTDAVWFAFCVNWWLRPACRYLCYFVKWKSESTQTHCRRLEKMQHKTMSY